MKRFDEKLLAYILAERLAPYVFQGEFGLEKENLRVDAEGKLALTPHPEVFGHKLNHPYITTDFAESQIEMITPVCRSIPEAYNFLSNLHNIISVSLEGEYLWPQSNPPILPAEEEIAIADFGPEGAEQNHYRAMLAQKYGKKKQLLSGIHYNFSFSKKFLEVLFHKFNQGQSFAEFKNDIYLKVAKNYLKYRWLLLYLTGASPVIHESFTDDYKGLCKKADPESYYCTRLLSVRNSRVGYKNTEDFYVSYENIETYIKDIETLIAQGKIYDAREFYCPVRLKVSRKPGSFHLLKTEGVGYMELRIFDLNPFAPIGIAREDLYLIHLFLLYALFKKDFAFTREQQELADINHNLANVAGMHKTAYLFNDAGELVPFQQHALSVLAEIESLIQMLGYKQEFYSGIIAAAKEKVLHPEKTYAAAIIREARAKTYIGFHLAKAKEYLAQSQALGGRMLGYEDMELSTQILMASAIKKGVQFTILDRKENFLRLRRGEKVEYVKQATKTSLDTYSTVLVMENKVVTKEVLKEHGIKVPPGEVFTELEEALAAYKLLQNKQIVVKPKSTNYGLGITIFKEPFTEEEYQKAVEFAFSYDDTVLVEEFIPGKEYRFLVMGDEVVGVLLRVPANVVGDGKKNIRQLVEEKNQDPLRGKGHRTPLEKITLGETEKDFLKAQGKDFDYIPKKGETVYLRENSNISTGGDSLDYTDLVHESYKQLARKAAKSVGAVITGIDMMIEDINQPHNGQNATIIELNFNPAIHIHCYPYRGKNRQAGDKVINLLFGV
ncbi:MAG: bifunctional glutamate--cysteine ligase GshA/glutathione synthetase GshB [Firmicutes bacterium]|nr:bifunctional glutamate--cysteine ligase GshA/glutathione synthetase GshB [Bacillota bacterium]